MQINIDLGEGGKYDLSFMPHITSCSIACGGHYGTVQTIKNTISLALSHGVNVGSHPSYPDKENFGRKSMNLKLNDFQDSIKSQLLKFKQALVFFNTKWHHCKAHGALYNDIAENGKLTQAYLEVLCEFPEINFLILPASKPIVKQAKKMRFNVLNEVFSDRKYNESFSLIPRNEKHSVIESSDEFSDNLNRLLNQNILLSNGFIKKISYDTICLHSDTPKSKKFLKIIKNIVSEKKL
tara:strand:+ start:11994 stop:12707 length:714 start_codon:yes stop_codon:yes gene_type:complete